MHNINVLTTQKEIDRISSNWQALLDIMPDMVFIFRVDHLIAYMNPSAVAKFGTLCDKYCHDTLCANKQCTSVCPLGFASRNEHTEPLMETKIGDVSVEFSFVKFHGYLGDDLVLVVMRDISIRKMHEQEITQFNTNIEKILRQKIHDLAESEKNRAHLLDEFEDLKSQLFEGRPVDDMIGSSNKMHRLRKMIAQVAKTDATVLVSGESGTGKELAANLIRNLSVRKDKPFLTVNCNTLSDSLLESELFGYEKGAFTGATSRRKGKFEIINTGTIFLDEIGDISPRMQGLLLRVLQNGEIMRVGGNEAIKVDLRIIAATNVDLAKAVQDGRFRLDLYYRLNIININIPALRSRPEDIPELANYFLKFYCKTFNKRVKPLCPAVLKLLHDYHWPGNIRELETVIQRAVLMARDNIIIEENVVFDSKPIREKHPAPAHSSLLQSESILKGGRSLKDILAEVEKKLLSDVLKIHSGNVQEAASFLQVGKTTLYDKMKAFGLVKKANQTS